MRRKVRQRIDRQQVHPRAGVGAAVGTASGQRRAERLREPQCSEVVDLHLELGHVGAAPRGNAERAVHLGAVDDDVDLAADLSGQSLHRAAVGEIQRHQRDGRQRRQRRQPAAVLLPRFGVAHPDQFGARLCEGAHQRLPERRHAIGHQHLALSRIVAHLAQDRIVSHRLPILRSGCNQHRLASAVEPRGHPHRRLRAIARHLHIAMQVHHQRRAGVELDQPETPRQALAKEQVVAVVQRGAGDQGALAALLAPVQTPARASHAGFARRVQHRAAIGALLQLEAPHRGGRRQTEGHSAASARRQVDLPRAQHRVLAPRPRRRWRHDTAPRISAPVHRQRS
jgi:hypothetical protein